MTWDTYLYLFSLSSLKTSDLGPVNGPHFWSFCSGQSSSSLRSPDQHELFTQSQEALVWGMSRNFGVICHLGWYLPHWVMRSHWKIHSISSWNGMGAHGPHLFAVGLCNVPTWHATQNFDFTQYYAVLRKTLLIISHRKNPPRLTRSQSATFHLFALKILDETMKADDHILGTARPILLNFWSRWS